MNRKNKFTICISSPPDRYKLVAEIFVENIQWVEINQEQNMLEIEFYQRPDGKPWRIGFIEAIEVLQEAKSQLVGKGK